MSTTKVRLRGGRVLAITDEEYAAHEARLTGGHAQPERRLSNAVAIAWIATALVFVIGCAVLGLVLAGDAVWMQP